MKIQSHVGVNALAEDAPRRVEKPQPVPARVTDATGGGQQQCAVRAVCAAALAQLGVRHVQQLLEDAEGGLHIRCPPHTSSIEAGLWLMEQPREELEDDTPCAVPREPPPRNAPQTLPGSSHAATDPRVVAIHDSDDDAWSIASSPRHEPLAGTDLPAQPEKDDDVWLAASSPRHAQQTQKNSRLHDLARLGCGSLVDGRSRAALGTDTSPPSSRATATARGSAEEDEVRGRADAAEGERAFSTEEDEGRGRSDAAKVDAGREARQQEEEEEEAGDPLSSEMPFRW